MALPENLRELFLLDQQVRGLQGRLDAATKRLAVQKSKLEQSNQQHEEIQNQLKHTQTKASTLENHSKDIEQRIERLRLQMQTVKSNKEYSAVLIEVNTLKENKSKIEDEAIEQLNQLDQINEQSNTLDESISEQIKLVEGAEKEFQTCRSDIGQELDDLNASRAAAEEKLPADIRTVFNRTANNFDGHSMAMVTEVSRRHREYICEGCYMRIPIERDNALMIQQEELVLCPNCNRILYIDQELKESIGSK